MKKALIYLTVLFAIVRVYAQENTKILDSGGLYSTPNLEAQRTSLEQQLGSALADEVIKYSTEANWMPSIKTFTQRIDNKSTLQSYNTRYIADSDNNNAILMISYENNMHVPISFRPPNGQPIYFVISKSKLALGSKVKWTSASGSSASETKKISLSDLKITNTDNFSVALQKICLDFENNFSSIQGSKIEPDKDETLASLSTEYVANIKLPNAEKCIIYKGLLQKSNSYIANYGSYKTPDEAKAIMNKLVSQIDDTKFGYSLVKNDLIEAESLTNQAYFPFDMNGVLSEKQKNMLIEVEMLKAFDFDKETFKLSDIWMVVLRVKDLDEK